MEYVGLKWYKCDFHLHTMKSKCYRDKDIDTPQSWVEEVKQKGLKCIAITDHNDYRGIDEIKQLCEENDIIAFPGVELSCDSSKVHLLILFDTTCSGENVRDFLSSVGIYSETLGDSASTGQGTIDQVCEKAQGMGALVIAAHIDEFNGICEISYDNVNKLLDRKYLSAVQVVNVDVWEKYQADHNIDAACAKLSEKYGREISKDKAKEWYNTYLQALNSDLPLLSFSDNPCDEGQSKHGLWGIGRSYTWLKMHTGPDLESVRQAFLSFDMRVRNIFESRNIPDIEPELWIQKVEIENTLLNENDTIEVSFNPQLNTIIGGRGSGKSSIIRVIAGGTKSFDAENLDLIKAEQDNFYKQVNKKDKKGIFQKDSKITMYLNRAEQSYKLEIDDIQNMENQSRKLYRLEEGEWIEISDVNYLDFFKAQIYTQKQIYELAIDSNSLLSIIDRDIQEIDQVVIDKDTKLNKVIAKCLEINDLEKTIGEETRYITELKDIEEQISRYESSGISEVLKKKQKFETQSKIFNDYYRTRNEQSEQLRKALDDLEPGDEKITIIEDLELKDIMTQAVERYAQRKNSIKEILDLINLDLENLKKEVEDSGWQNTGKDIATQYNEVVAKLRNEGINFDKLDELLEKKKSKINDLDKVRVSKEKLEIIQEERKQLYAEYSDASTQISQMRTKFLNNVIGQDTNVKFQIQRRRNRVSFIQMMKTVLNKSNATIDEDIEMFADIFFGKDGTEKFREVVQNIRNKNNTTDYAARTRAAITEMTPEAFARMIYFIPEDDLVVSYKPEKSKKYIPLSNASAGQKTTAILTFLLAYGNLPLLLDQPEDDLDNKLVYDLIVTRLKKTKSKRQIIVVTHNANIPVNGDAEYIISMDSDTDLIKTKYQGTMDDGNIRKEICDVMEGTQIAFEMRAKKYHFRIVE
jgi:ABC-type cobalamin/Fe3+-siderophores transport system ATPase subunit